MTDPAPLPDWRQANPNRIARSLDRALGRPSGGWFVLGASREVRPGPRRYRVQDRDLVAWRPGDGELRVAPDTCPHMGASLARGRVEGACVVCPWHGLALDGSPHGAWRAIPAHDDGVLLWARLDAAGEAGADPPTDGPILAARPERYVDAVMRTDAVCEPRDVIANRLDPWHGVHFHPYAFDRLEVIEATGDELHLDVTYKLGGRIRLPVKSRFHCPDPRTIVMTILDGEGAGSVVETHATPISPGRTAIVEATFATSDRPGFRHLLARPGLMRWIIGRASRRLWIDDAAYAERLYEVRSAPRQ
ncbi:DUF5914 domain-containing protein [soil metagenome]